jgi:hypothetical protein
VPACCSCLRRAEGERSSGQAFLRGSAIVRLGKTIVMRYMVATKLNSGASLSATDAGKAVPNRRIMIGGQP